MEIKKVVDTYSIKASWTAFRRSTKPLLFSIFFLIVINDWTIYLFLILFSFSSFFYGPESKIERNQVAIFHFYFGKKEFKFILCPNWTSAKIVRWQYKLLSKRPTSTTINKQSTFYGSIEIDNACDSTMLYSSVAMFEIQTSLLFFVVSTYRWDKETITSYPNTSYYFHSISTLSVFISVAKHVPAKIKLFRGKHNLMLLDFFCNRVLVEVM